MTPNLNDGGKAKAAARYMAARHLSDIKAAIAFGISSKAVQVYRRDHPAARPDGWKPGLVEVAQYIAPTPRDGIRQVNRVSVRAEPWNTPPAAENTPPHGQGGSG